jgi:hypothetical protein
MARALTDLWQSQRRAVAHVLDRLARLADHVAGAGADVLDGLADAPDELRIAIDRGHNAIDDRAHVVEPDLEQSLRLDALDVDLQSAEVDVEPDVQCDQVEDLGLERDVRLEVRDLEIDLVDLDHRDVEQHVRVLARLCQRRGGVVAVFALGDCRAAVDVLREAVLLALLRRGARIRPWGHRLAIRRGAALARFAAAPRATRVAAVGRARLLGLRRHYPPPPLAPLPTPSTPRPAPWPTPVTPR